MTHARRHGLRASPPGSVAIVEPVTVGSWSACRPARHYRSLNLPVLFPPSPDELDYIPRQPRTWLGRYAGRQREIIRAEFAARGYPLPD